MTKEQAKIIYKDVINQFGYINNPASVDAVYILRDGNFLDTCGGYPNHQHINVAKYISQKYNINDINELNNGSNFMLNIAGAVKVTCWNQGKGIKGIYLPKAPLKAEQYDAIEEFIARVAKYVTEEWPLWVATYEEGQQIEYTKSYQLEDRVIGDIDHYYYSGKLELTENLRLHEDTRTMLVSKSRNAGSYIDQSRGKNRFERKKLSKIAKTVKQYNQIDMNKFFKDDILEVKIPVQGETDQYTVSIRLAGIVNEIAKNIKNNQNKFEYRTVIQAITKVFNTGNVYVKCTCPDFKYNFAHNLIVANVSTDDSSSDPGPGKGIRNPNDDKGRGCKHILLVLANGSWIMQVSSVIKNYITYASTNLKKPFLKIIFPKLYGMTIEEASENNIVPEDADLNLQTDESIIDIINEYSKNKGKFKPGTNKNPAKGTGKIDLDTIKQEEDKKDNEKD